MVDSRHCLGQLWLQKIGIILNQRTNLPIFFVGPLCLYLPTRENFAPPCTSLNMVQNLILSDQCWTLLLYSGPIREADVCLICHPVIQEIFGHNNQLRS